VFLAWPSLLLRLALRAAAGGSTTMMTVMLVSMPMMYQCHTEAVAMPRAAVGHSETAQSMA